MTETNHLPNLMSMWDRERQQFVVPVGTVLNHYATTMTVRVKARTERARPNGLLRFHYDFEPPLVGPRRQAMDVTHHWALVSLPDMPREEVAPQPEVDISGFSAEHIQDVDTIAKAFADWSVNRFGTEYTNTGAIGMPRHYRAVMRALTRKTMHLPIREFSYADLDVFRGWRDARVTRRVRDTYAPEHIADVNTFAALIVRYADHSGWCADFDGLLRQTNDRMHVRMPGRRYSIQVQVTLYFDPDALMNRPTETHEDAPGVEARRLVNQALEPLRGRIGEVVVSAYAGNPVAQVTRPGTTWDA